MTGKDNRPKDAHGWTLEGDRYIGPHKYIRPAKAQPKVNEIKDRITEDKRDENKDAQKRDA